MRKQKDVSCCLSVSVMEMYFFLSYFNLGKSKNRLKYHRLFLTVPSLGWSIKCKFNESHQC